MKTKTVTFILILLTVINLTGFGFMVYHRFSAPRPFHAMHAPRGHGPRGIVRELELRPRQIKKIARFRKRLHTQTAGLRDSLRHAHSLLMEQMRADVPDSAAIDSILGHISRFQSQVHKKAVYGMLKEKGILTPEQQDRLMKHFERHFCDRGPHFHGKHFTRNKRRHSQRDRMRKEFSDENRR
ncbi:MAG: periplasmic heavy metal sensor [Chitinivibrionales bacterium]|nr:periplasmic heavy metal sensor [Chitinivibrionales bacterium]